MKFIRFLGVLWFLIPCVSFAAGMEEFQNASKLLVAARNGDIQTVQFLINNGTDVNFVDSTGLSLVCTAVMNNDKRAIQVLQMYGADASNCDRQIKQYQQKSKVATKGEEYGFFSGLSSTHVIALSAVGVAAVLGGVVLLTKVFDDDGGGSGSGGSSGERPNNNNNQNTTTDASKLFALNLPYGPACSSTGCPSDFSVWEDSQDFAYMSNVSLQDTFNYLMVAHAYNAFVRGYEGMRTIRLTSDLSPYDLSSLPYASVPGGGAPVNVAMITGTGVNKTGSAIDGTITWIDSTQINTVVSACKNDPDSDACTAAKTAALENSNKYFNLNGGTENSAFDLSGGGTVFGMASNSDTKAAKIIAGWEEGGRTVGDFVGFIPNGQLTVYKTGAGNAWVDTTETEITGTYLKTGDELTSLSLANGTNLTVTSVSGDSFVATDASDNVYNGYLIGDTLYIDSNADGSINQMYSLGDENALTLTKELTTSDYKNYAAIYDTLRLTDTPNVIVNLALPAESYQSNYATVDDANFSYSAIINGGSSNAATLAKVDYLGRINSNYNLNTGDDTSVNTPGLDAKCVFEGGCTGQPTYATLSGKSTILINPAGYSVVSDGDSLWLPKKATFENFAPVIYSDLQNLFMTVVAVKPQSKTGTYNIQVDDYSAENVGKLGLSTWADADDDTIMYSSRMCGLTGSGNGGAMNPWCFAAPGVTDTEAAAAMAGSVALVKSAFDYMSSQQIFLLLALTADGPYLGTNPETGLAWTSTDLLISYLQDMYVLPTSTSNADYLNTFKETFGYGMINLERATRPGTNVYYYSNKDTIVSSAGNSYWRTASSRASNALSLTGRGTIKATFFDVLESADGSISLPRVWTADIAMGGNSRHGLYMGDVLGEFSVDSSNKKTSQIGDWTFDMAMSARAYNDNLNGLDSLRVAFNGTRYDIDANYQRFLTDGMSRFDGRANGVLGLTANAMSVGAKYKMGKIAFGTRAFSGAITNENLLENDPEISSQFEPERLGFANGAALNAEYNTDKFGFNVSFGNMHETNTVLGMYSDGLIALNGANTQYIDTVATYEPVDNVKLLARATFANTRADIGSGLITELSNIESNAFVLGVDVGGFEFTAAMPLAVVRGKMGYDYADLEVVENDGEYEVVALNPHTEEIDLSSQKRELRFSSSYKRPIGEFTDAGLGFIYRVNPNNTDDFGNESIFMFKLHHRLGI
ncbi:MAG: hypothetical protein J6W08_03425 [Alphaproteobacteria bacterium]|nr:hypothetical protein [Alphaproteobacteria bacterium]